MRWEVTISTRQWDQLQAHLFPGDGDEHGAVMRAGVARGSRANRLLVRDVIPAIDGVDYVPGERGYRMLTPTFVRDQVLACAGEDLAYLAVHNHGGGASVAFSRPDLASHERGYPALCEILDGGIVGALVFARDALAGDLWLPDGERALVDSLRVVGGSSRTLTPSPRSRTERARPEYDRQARLFGDEGQLLLRGQKIGVIGAGGVGSLVVEYLSRLGVGHLVVVDPDRLELSNLSRVVGSQLSDTYRGRRWRARAFGRKAGLHKVAIARRVALTANPTLRIEAIVGDVSSPEVALTLSDCDYLFLAADTMQARLVFNALVHQYLIPGVQMGAKATIDSSTGAVLDVFSVVRPVNPDSGCLWCNELITPSRLQDEALTSEDRHRQRYVDDEAVAAPSVITLNAVAASHAVDEYLFRLIGLRRSPETPYLRFRPQLGDFAHETPRSDASCRECGSTTGSRRGRGDQTRLPTRLGS